MSWRGALGYEQVRLVAHDIGARVAFPVYAGPSGGGAESWR